MKTFDMQDWRENEGPVGVWRDCEEQNIKCVVEQSSGCGSGGRCTLLEGGG